MDKQGVGVDMWTSLQNAQLDHMPTPPTHAYPQGLAFGLTRFACRHPFEKMRPKTPTAGEGNLYSHQFVVRKFTVRSGS